MHLLYDNDINKNALHGLKIAVIGFGAQGKAQSLNLHDSCQDVTVALRKNSESFKETAANHLKALPIDEAISNADVIALLAPDESHQAIDETFIIPFAKPGATLVLAHGFSVHYQLVKARPDMNIVLVAPKGAGREVRQSFVRGGGVPALIAIWQDATGTAENIALAFAAHLGCGKAGILRTTFKEEVETDLFGEQVVLCGGVNALVEAAFDTLVDAGYPETLAYFECLHELKLTVDLLHRHGISGMREHISNTAEFGDYVTGPRIIDANTKERMKSILKGIQSGQFAKDFVQEAASGYPVMKEKRQQTAEKNIEKIGRQLRNLMGWGKET